MAEALSVRRVSTSDSIRLDSDLDPNGDCPVSQVTDI